MNDSTPVQTGCEMRALIVEDESRIARNLQRALETLPSFAADVLGDGLEAWERLGSGEPYDLLLLDRMLPGMDGLEVLRRLRASGSRLPVLVLTALGAKEEIVRGLDYGCDDYLVKPYDTGELLARCKALVRRGQEHPAPVLRVADLRVDTRAHAVARGDRPIDLPALEYRLLEYLAYRPGAVVSKSELLEHLYDYNWEKFSNVIEHYVWSLRSKLEAKGEPRLLHTVRGVGYRLSERSEA
jgi:DNA-binding response OmpR family regulator